MSLRPQPIAPIPEQTARVAHAAFPKGHPDTVGEPKSAEVYLSYMPSLKAKKLGKHSQEKVLLEL
jgi:hypothetical protein